MLIQDATGKTVNRADDLARFMGDTAAADIHKAKAQAYASVLRCIENLEAQENQNGQLTKPS